MELFLGKFNAFLSPCRMALREGNMGAMSTAVYSGVMPRLPVLAVLAMVEAGLVRLLSVPVCARPAVWALLARLSRLSCGVELLGVWVASLLLFMALSKSSLY